MRFYRWLRTGVAAGLMIGLAAAPAYAQTQRSFEEIATNVAVRVSSYNKKLEQAYAILGRLDLIIGILNKAPSPADIEYLRKLRVYVSDSPKNFTSTGKRCYFLLFCRRTESRRIY